MSLINFNNADILSIVKSQFPKTQILMRSLLAVNKIFHIDPVLSIVQYRTNIYYHSE